ncbi:pseudaminic acid cytidylyltransferase [Helicobacter fennelliae]|uniref:pseudaminic acid cytidylyltransferase n=1 Tax=Helicobacter fennelliae TaxID=215 RepID=UPI000E075240|nr:pseudaminic acid cytidylyltransferase [Helicobacter fennelliae]STQ84892.1 acylneuraminate cytidylyltransferase [Helicobacter fennelliae]
MNICIIPARSGSKRIPHKNIKQFCGKPIISYSIQNAIESKIFDHIIVSTDDAKIATIAQKYGAQTPFLRPKKLSNDLCATLPVIAHAITALKLSQDDLKSCFVCCLYPTAPLIDSTHITQAYTHLTQNPNKEYVFYATKLEKSPLRAFTLDTHNAPHLLFSQFEQSRSQDLDSVFVDAGVLYFGKANAFLAQKLIFHTHSMALILESSLAQDIDTPLDWQIAKAKYRAKLKHNATSHTTHKITKDKAQ